MVSGQKGVEARHFVIQDERDSFVGHLQSNLPHAKIRHTHSSCKFWLASSQRLLKNFRMTLEGRFWKKVNKRGPRECWEWTACRNRKGYGLINILGSSQLAHRVSFSLLVGEIPGSRLVCHTCDNPSCVNPCHLFLGTHKSNMDDKMAKGRHKCPRGSRHSSAKLTESKVLHIRREYSGGGVSMASLAKKFQVSAAAVEFIIQRRTWRHVP